MARTVFSARSVVAIAAVTLGAGCMGSIDGSAEPDRGGGGGEGGGPGGSVGVGPSCAAGIVPVSTARLRRLSPDQYANTARDLLADPKAEAHLAGGDGAIISGLEVDRLNQTAAELVARGAHRTQVPCDINGPENLTCAQAFVDTFGRRAFRRPVEAEEKAWLTGVFSKAIRLGGSFRTAIDTVAQVILQSPQHLYLHEVGVADSSLPAGVRRLSGHERATRLSYMFWASTPDPALMQAAAEGRLDSAEGVRAQALRLLDSPRARGTVGKFASSWLELDGLADQPKNAGKFRMDNPALRTAMKAETEALFEKAFFEPGGSLRTLMTSTQAYVTGPLAQLYGVATPVAAGQSAWVSLDGGQRAGLFTRAAFLASHANEDFQSPIHRGVFLYRHALCQSIPDPPPDTDDTPVAPSAQQLKSVRDLTVAKTAGGVCASCHDILNPIGFTLENFDALGRWQVTESGRIDGKAYNVPVNATATVRAADIAGEINGGVALSGRLAESLAARDCLVETWFSESFGRAPTTEEICKVDEFKTWFRQNDDLRGLAVNVASSEPALFIKGATP